MSNFQNIQYEKKSGIAYVTVDRPKSLNALNFQTLTEITAAFEDARDDDAVHGVIVTGSGNKAFVAGADISEIAALSAVAAEKFAGLGHSTMNLIETLGKPVIAAVNGFALGGGCELAMACTMRIASEHAKFGQPEVKLGIIPGFGGTQRLPRLVGKGIAMQLILTAALIDANEAHRIGLVNEVVEADKLIARAEQILNQIAANAPIATRLAITAVNQGVETSLEQALSLERALFAVCAATEDKAEGTAAFLDKRAPTFQSK
ncbi:enoyl-CoA hydratase-related protein [Burkholderia vietnamiensis]|uniref:enoyl-CoA hydratase-related protein n=1 Tax=Burkholderia vietnamiensis TaxID=60552 RepID=UPI0007540457|nr:enoyl-CoA hydratase-related protein [Burkholderia vietnamiensis]KVE52486.1 enoyl-CoA hydratase [Burkholderia vietnamiensis]KVE68294.1 enoyl-CoA hydratase [Burkholderia vietnamiensis]KVE88334.1 enoyl-CoA hydratase [Burkholderia vietnamiensis]MDN7926652.1 enoyl-CoA hydratase-related protein [Burkholderia vietnamiensis]HDR9054574.1 enoyl-CoA hydratase/isomerase family protein [Burkholderia vietnamiensis]